MSNKLKIAFFGGEPLGPATLEHLIRSGLTPSLVVCNPDRKSGRGLSLTPPRVKVCADTYNIPVFQPKSYTNRDVLTEITATPWDLFIVVAYNFILPKWLLDIPTHGVLNVHPSLLPKLRGASPIRTAILENLPEDVGISIMLMDEEMDHGPLLTQVPLTLNEWPIDGMLLDDMLGQIGGEILTSTIPAWIEGTITPTAQDHKVATYTKKFKKADSELHLDPINLPVGQAAISTFLKINAFSGIGDTFFIDKGIRIKIKRASLEGDALVIKRVIPEGKKEMDFESYLLSRTT